MMSVRVLVSTDIRLKRGKACTEDDRGAEKEDEHAQSHLEARVSVRISSRLKENAPSLATRGWNRFDRPAWTTGCLIPLSFGCGSTTLSAPAFGAHADPRFAVGAAVLIWKSGEKTKVRSLAAQ